MDSTQPMNDSKRKDPGVSKGNFDKKKWRDKKYSAKAKVQKWENIKRRQALRQCSKDLKKSGGSFVCNKNPKFTKNVFISDLKQAQEEYEKKKKEKEERRKEAERIKQEKIEAIKAYKERKIEKFKKLCQKTRKGQPIMRGRLELLLEKIEREYAVHNNKRTFK